MKCVVREASRGETTGKKEEIHSYCLQSQLHTEAMKLDLFEENKEPIHFSSFQGFLSRVGVTEDQRDILQISSVLHT